MQPSDLVDIADRASNYQPVTREEAEYLVRSQGRWCKGPKKEGADAEYAKMREVVGMTGGQEQGFDLATMDAVLREGCGYDFNEVLMQYPLDGNEHFVPCPKCGMTISFRSPIFVLSD